MLKQDYKANEYITFNSSKVLEFKELYIKAIQNNKKSFVFKGRLFLTAFAKHFLNYLESKFKTLH